MQLCLKSFVAGIGLLGLLSGCGTPAAGPLGKLEQRGNMAPAGGSAASADRYLDLGQAAEAKGDFTVAAMMYQAAVQASASSGDPGDPGDPGNPGDQSSKAAAALARVQQRLDRPEAERGSMAATKPDRLADELQAARRALSQGEAVEAATLYTQLIDAADAADSPLDPAIAWRAYNGLGAARSQTGEQAAAVAAFTTALALAPLPQQVAVRCNLALAQLLQSDYRAAIDLLQPRVAAHAATADETKLLALAYGFVGRIADAQRLGLKEPPSPDLLRQLQVPAVDAGAALPVDL